MRASQCAQGATQPQALQNKLRRIAAAIQEHDDLAARLEVLLHGLHRRCRQSLIGRVLAQIHQRHSRRLRRPRPLRQHDASSSAPVAAFSRVSSDGVAEPSTMGTAAPRALTTARSRAE